MAARVTATTTGFQRSLPRLSLIGYNARYSSLSLVAVVVIVVVVAGFVCHTFGHVVALVVGRSPSIICSQSSGGGGSRQRERRSCRRKSCLHLTSAAQLSHGKETRDFE